MTVSGCFNHWFPLFLSFTERGLYLFLTLSLSRSIIYFVLGLPFSTKQSYIYKGKGKIEITSHSSNNFPLRRDRDLGSVFGTPLDGRLAPADRGAKIWEGTTFTRITRLVISSRPPPFPSVTPVILGIELPGPQSNTISDPLRLSDSYSLRTDEFPNRTLRFPPTVTIWMGDEAISLVVGLNLFPLKRTTSAPTSQDTHKETPREPPTCRV